MNKEIKTEKYIKIKEIVESKYTISIVNMISIVLFAISILIKQYNLAFISIMTIWLYSILYGMVDLKQRIVFVMMNFMLFTFVLDRPFINMFNGLGWKNFSELTTQKALIAIFLTEIFMFFGTQLNEKLLTMHYENEDFKQKNYSKIFQTTILILVIITGLVSAYVEIIKYIDMKDVDYALNYTDKVIEFPLLIRTLATLFSYCVFAYLSTMPNKTKSFLVLCAYMLLAIPSFLLGSRNGLILRVIFSFIYIVIRYIIDNNENWITLKMKIIAIIMIPIAIIFLGAYNYIRSDEEIETKNPFLLIVDFFYKQGTTFDTICQGFEYEDKLKNQPNVISYTFGDIIDYLIHNSISQKIFGTEDLGSGNSMKMVEKSNSLAHRLSYNVLGSPSYLSGHGRGTSYIIETYMDIGMIGVIIYSLILGIFLSSIIPIIKKNSFLLNYIILTSLSQLFLLPRYSATGFLSFIVTPQFWVIIVLLYIVKFLCKKLIKGENDESTKIS